ncbi:PREDICTED: uncharacterized protein LOC104763060 [Camelina sativa]|uniref:Uncharacterized protein LOC104763060 n=1 Tax=Camelina sativa TaxID=90675 RepID=A0ABM1R967_CAMSA|nr:PREDICTED: uncharacterized protein LOC104763060 [Camelina sativa]
MGSSSSGKNKKGRRNKEAEDDDSNNLNADAIPKSSREVVKNMKEVVNCCEQEIYAMLVECNMDADEAITRLLSQDSFQEVKSKRDKKKKTKDSSDFQRFCSSNQNCELRNGSDDYVGGNKFNSDERSDVQRLPNHLAGSSTTAGILGPGPPLNRVSSSRLISALGCGSSSQNGLGSSKESVTKAPVKDDCLLPEKPVVPNPFPNSFFESAARRDQLPESASVSNQNLHDGGSHLLCDNYNNKNDETCQVQKCSFEHNQTKDPSVPVNSDQCSINQLEHLRFGCFSGINGSGKPSGLPSKFLNDDSEDISDSADDVSLKNLNSKDSFQQGNKSKGDKKKENVSNGETKIVPISSGEAVTSLSVPSSRYQSSWGFDTYCQETVADVVQMGLASSQENVTNALEKKPDVPNPLSNSFSESTAIRDQLQESAFISNENFPDDIDDCGDKNDETYQEQRPKESSASVKTNLLQSAAFVKELLKFHRDGEFHSSSNCDPTEPTQENQYTSSSVTDFTFDNSQLFTPVMAPSERSLQMQNANTFPNAMHQQAYTRELNPWYSASPLNQSMPTASSLGRRLSVSRTEMNQTMNHHLYSQPNVPSGHYGHMMNYPCPLPIQNDTYDMPTPAFPQHGGSNNNAYHQHSLVPLYRTSDLRQPAVTAAVPSTRSSAYGSAYDSAYGFGNHLSSLQHQNGNSNMWTTPQGHNNSGRNYCSSLFPGQQSLSFRHAQQQVEPEEPYRFERSRRYYESLDQQNNRRGDPPNQTQQQQPPRNNN